MQPQKPIAKRQPTFWEKSILYLHGYHDAYSMAECYKRGRYVKKDLEIAELLYRRAIQEGNKEAHFSLGELYEEKSKSIVSRQEQKILYQQALKIYFNCALQGNSESTVKIKQAAVAGNAIAYYYLGVIYEREQNFEIAVEYYRVAAIDEEVLAYAMNALVQMAKFNSKAALCLAKMYEKHELGFLKNAESMMEYYEKANTLKDKDAGLRLGQLYQVDHDGTKRNMNKAWDFYVQAAINGSQEAIAPLERLGEDVDAHRQRQIGDLYNLSFFKNPAKTAHWYSKAKETESLQLVSKPNLESEPEKKEIAYL